MIAKEKVLVVDVDGTLCPEKQPGQSYADLPVEPQLLARLKALKAEGWHIVLHSARGMRTHEGNQGALYAHVLPVMLDWAARNGVPYDEILLGKPWPGRDGFYVDDRAVRPREFLENDLEGLAALVARDRVARPEEGE
ncbi:MAG: capsular biosynthesis protein [Pseudomonadota bacterium]